MASLTILFCISSGNTLAITISTMMKSSKSCKCTLPGNIQEKIDRFTTGRSVFAIRKPPLIGNNARRVIRNADPSLQVHHSSRIRVFNKHSGFTGCQKYILEK
jgi:hypothetical protein